MEKPDVPNLLKTSSFEGFNIDLKGITYYVGHETIIAKNDKHSLPKWLVRIFAFLHRNCLHKSEYFMLPTDSVVEVGRQIAI